MNLHELIINMRRVRPDRPYKTPETAHLAGYRDARHEAAELAKKADACIEALRDIMDTGFAGGPQAKRALKALASLDDSAVG